MKRLLRIGLVLLATCAVADVATEARRRTPARFFVFGDSLSDTGNAFVLTKILGLQPALPPSESPNRTYYLGRFANGPVAFEYLWGRLRSDEPVVPAYLASAGLPREGAVSFAFGTTGSGAVTDTAGVLLPGALGQIELFASALEGRRAPQDALYAVFTGANDYIVGAGQQPLPPAVVVGNIVHGIERLYDLGARQIIVPNLADLGLLPFLGFPPEARQTATTLTVLHNQLLAQRLATLWRELPGVEIVDVDLFAFVGSLDHMQFTVPALDVLADPLPGGIPASMCIFVLPSQCPDVPLDAPAGYFFWDAKHPTTAAHEAVAAHIYDVLRASRPGAPGRP